MYACLSKDILRPACHRLLKKVKVAHTRLLEHRVPELIPVLGSQAARVT